MAWNKILIISIVLLGINVLAFSANYFRLSPKFNAGMSDGNYEIYILTDATDTTSVQNPRFSEPECAFWPFVNYCESHALSKDNTVGKFRGLFADYGGTEFAFYSFMIVVVMGFLRFW